MFFPEILKKTSLAALPFTALLFLLHLFLLPEKSGVWSLAAGWLLLSSGMAVFISGVDIGILPMGQKAGSELANRRSLPLLCAFCFVAGFFITASEPHLGILAVWTKRLAPGAGRLSSAAAISAGVGLFAALAAGRIVLQISLKKILTFFYILILGGACLAETPFTGLLLGAGGVAAGPMAVPFILALGMGIAAVRGGSEAGSDSFGLLGLTGLGPILALLLLGAIFPGEWSGGVYERKEAAGTLLSFLLLIPASLKEMGIAALPLLVLLILFGTTLFNLSRLQVIRFTKGLLYAFAGLCIFFTGLRGGFMAEGNLLGNALALTDNKAITTLAGMLLGAMTVWVEPTVWVLNARAEAAPGGNISHNHIMAALSLSAACATGLALLQAMNGLNPLCLILPGYALALLLSIFCPRLFTALAFDSGVVMIGPVTCIFMLSLVTSAAALPERATGFFGLIALFAMTPLLFIQILGILLQRKQRLNERRRAGKEAAPAGRQ
ncbi:MAG: DUF1538 domain-containing protein [Deltaproteobacteria bacterium]|nr:DUF1538 domain-containing protein [Deltaproteobacteria bacterium]